MTNPKLRKAPGDVVWNRDNADRAAWVRRVADWAQTNNTRVTFTDIEAERERRMTLRRNWRALFRDRHDDSTDLTAQHEG